MRLPGLVIELMKSMFWTKYWDELPNKIFKFKNRDFVIYAFQNFILLFFNPNETDVDLHSLTLFSWLKKEFRHRNSKPFLSILKKEENDKINFHYAFLLR